MTPSNGGCVQSSSGPVGTTWEMNGTVNRHTELFSEKLVSLRNWTYVRVSRKYYQATVSHITAVSPHIGNIIMEFHCLDDESLFL